MKRNEKKAKTREIIIKSTMSLLSKNGYIKVSTKDISENAGVSQGSIFLHFYTKDLLLNEILTTSLKLIENDCRELLPNSVDDIKFINSLLDILINHESMLSRAFVDYPYLSENMRKTVQNFENFLKNVIFDHLKDISSDLNILDSFISIDAFLSQIIKVFYEKDYLNTQSSALRSRRGKLIKLYKTLFINQ